MLAIVFLFASMARSYQYRIAGPVFFDGMYHT
jgi:hypothetical protein